MKGTLGAKLSSLIQRVADNSSATSIKLEIKKVPSLDGSMMAVAEVWFKPSNRKGYIEQVSGSLETIQGELDNLAFVEEYSAENFGDIL